jgi:hypothetical protein
MLLPTLVVGMIMFEGAQANDVADLSKHHGFLSKYMSVGSDASKGGVRASPMINGPLATSRDKLAEPSTHVQDSMGFTSSVREPFISRTKFDAPKVEDEKDGTAAQKLLANNNNMSIGWSAIGVALFTLAGMLGVRMWRGAQPATTMAMAHGADMSTPMVDNVMELKVQTSTVRGQAGWLQPSSRNLRPLTVSYATAISDEDATARAKNAMAAAMAMGDGAVDEQLAVAMALGDEAMTVAMAMALGEETVLGDEIAVAMAATSISDEVVMARAARIAMAAAMTLGDEQKVVEPIAPAFLETVASPPLNVAPTPAWSIARDMRAGISAPLGFFDPLGFSWDASWERVKYYRECEIKHGRVAMLAAIGFPIGEHFHSIFGVDVPSYIAYQQTPLQTFWLVVLLCVGALETFSISTFENPFEPDGRLWTLKEDHKPGDFQYDPMGMCPTDPPLRVQMQTRELNHGRLAMIGIAGMVAQELATGTKLF